MAYLVGSRGTGCSDDRRVDSDIEFSGPTYINRTTRLVHIWEEGEIYAHSARIAGSDKSMISEDKRDI